MSAPLQARGSLLSILSVQLRLRHQPPSPGSCGGAVTWGEAAVGPRLSLLPLTMCCLSLPPLPPAAFSPWGPSPHTPR